MGCFTANVNVNAYCKKESPWSIQVSISLSCILRGYINRVIRLGLYKYKPKYKYIKFKKLVNAAYLEIQFQHIKSVGHVQFDEKIINISLK